MPKVGAEGSEAWARRLESLADEIRGPEGEYDHNYDLGSMVGLLAAVERESVGRGETWRSHVRNAFEDAFFRHRLDPPPNPEPPDSPQDWGPLSENEMVWAAEFFATLEQRAWKMRHNNVKFAMMHGDEGMSLKALGGARAAVYRMVAEVRRLRKWEREQKREVGDGGPATNI